MARPQTLQLKMLLLLVACATVSLRVVDATMLHDKAREGDVVFFNDNAEDLASDPASLNEVEPGTGQTALMSATLAGKAQIVDKLLQLGADVNIAEKDGYTPPHGAAFQGRPEAARMLIKHGVPMDQVHSDGFRPLHRTIWGKKAHHLETAKVFVMEGKVNVDSLNGQGLPATHVALGDSEYNPPWLEMLRALLFEMGADPNSKNSDGETLLHVAVKTKNEDVVKIVLEAGADITVKDSTGVTAKGLAKQTEAPSGIISLLADASAKRKREVFGSKEEL